MFDFLRKNARKINTTDTIDLIESRVYEMLKPLGFRKHGRTLHRFVDGDISQVIYFQCGQAYRNETHLMWVNTGIRVPESFLRTFHPEEEPKKYYHEYECNIRSDLGVIEKGSSIPYDLRKNTETITADIIKQLNKKVLPVFDVLSSRNAILSERRNYPRFDITNRHLILLEEAMIYGRLGNLEQAENTFRQYYKKCLTEKPPVLPHIQLLKELAEKLNIPLEDSSL